MNDLNEKKNFNKYFKYQDELKRIQKKVITLGESEIRISRCCLNILRSQFNKNVIWKGEYKGEEYEYLLDRFMMARSVRFLNILKKYEDNVKDERNNNNNKNEGKKEENKINRLYKINNIIEVRFNGKSITEEIIIKTNGISPIVVEGIIKYIYQNEILIPKDISLIESFIILSRELYLVPLNDYLTTRFTSKKEGNITFKYDKKDMKNIRNYSLKNYMYNILYNPVYTKLTYDIILQIEFEDGESDEQIKYYTHKSLLVNSSEYFELMFNGRFAESTSPSDIIKLGNTSNHIFNILLHSFYFMEFPNLSQMDSLFTSNDNDLLKVILNDCINGNLEEEEEGKQLIQQHVFLKELTDYNEISKEEQYNHSYRFDQLLFVDVFSELIHCSNYFLINKVLFFDTIENLFEKIDIENICIIWNFAYEYKLEDLSEICYDFFIQNFGFICNTYNFRFLKRELFLNVLEKGDIDLPTNFLLSSLFYWAEYNLLGDNNNNNNNNNNNEEEDNHGIVDQKEMENEYKKFIYEKKHEKIDDLISNNQDHAFFLLKEFLPPQVLFSKAIKQSILGSHDFMNPNYFV